MFTITLIDEKKYTIPSFIPYLHIIYSCVHVLLNFLPIAHNHLSLGEIHKRNLWEIETAQSEMEFVFDCGATDKDLLDATLEEFSLHKKWKMTYKDSKTNSTG